MDVYCVTSFYIHPLLVFCPKNPNYLIIVVKYQYPNLTIILTNLQKEPKYDNINCFLH